MQTLKHQHECYFQGNNAGRHPIHVDGVFILKSSLGIGFFFPQLLKDILSLTGERLGWLYRSVLYLPTNSTCAQ